jgi:hypothetical protein
MGFGTGSGSTGISGAADVALNNPLNSEVLTFDSSTSKWKNATATLGEVSSVAGKTGVVSLVKADVGLSNVDDTADSDKPVSNATQALLNTKVTSDDVRLTDARVPIDASVTTAKLNDGAVTVSKLSTSAQISLSKADSALQTAPVTSVATRTGAITLSKADVGLSNVDNTSDASKPVSTATLDALNAKANTVHVHAASDITTGIIESSHLPLATDTVAGIVELATVEEVSTGTDTTRAATPAGVKSLVSAAVQTAIPTVLFVNSLANIPAGTPVDTLVVVRAA